MIDLDPAQGFEPHSLGDYPSELPILHCRKHVSADIVSYQEPYRKVSKQKNHLPTTCQSVTVTSRNMTTGQEAILKPVLEIALMIGLIIFAVMVVAVGIAKVKKQSRKRHHKQPQSEPYDKKSDATFGRG